MALDTYSISNTGLERSNNQDMFSNYFHSKFSLLVVADGMGGYEGGEIASKIAAETTRDYVVSNKDCEEYQKLLIDAIREANLAVHNKAQSEENLRRMGTTIVAAIISDDNAWIANVGDSRCYIFRDKILSKISQDHSVGEDLVRKGVITDEEAQKHPEKDKLTRAIGVGEDVEIYCTNYKLKNRDKLLLCSDGLTKMVSDVDIAGILKKYADCKADCEELVKLANGNGGHDNITATVFEYRSE